MNLLKKGLTCSLSLMMALSPICLNKCFASDCEEDSVCSNDFFNYKAPDYDDDQSYKYIFQRLMEHIDLDKNEILWSYYGTSEDGIMRYSVKRVTLKELRSIEENINDYLSDEKVLQQIEKNVPADLLDRNVDLPAVEEVSENEDDLQKLEGVRQILANLNLQDVGEVPQNIEESNRIDKDVLADLQDGKNIYQVEKDISDDLEEKDKLRQIDKELNWWAKSQCGPDVELIAYHGEFPSYGRSCSMENGVVTERETVTGLHKFTIRKKGEIKSFSFGGCFC